MAGNPLMKPDEGLPAFPSGRQSRRHFSLPPNCSLRPCRTSDLPFLQRLFRHVRAPELAASGWPEALKTAFCTDQFAAQHRHYLKQFPDADFLLLRQNGSPAGRLYVDFSGTGIHLIDISLLPGHQKKGLGGHLIRNIQMLARADRRPVSLAVLKNNTAAHRLYDRYGFMQQRQDDTRHYLIWMPD
jgi:ribosomal protein S18 acetylase RimI-like enzyme